MNLAQQIQLIAEQLNAHYRDKDLSTQYAWWMLQAITKKSQSELLIAEATQQLKLSPAEHNKLQEWIRLQVQEAKPLQYIFGSVPFGDLTITVAPPTLIPRPETEEWCLKLIELYKKHNYAPRAILDLCTGTGCIALTLAHAFPQAQVYAIDIAPEALKLAEHNARINKITNCTFIQSNLFEAFEKNNQKFDLITANPPYIDPALWNELDLSVTKWEDPRALIAQDKGVAILKSIIEQAHNYLNEAPSHYTGPHDTHSITTDKLPQLVVEIGYDQKDCVTMLMKQSLFGAIHHWHDAAGKDRVVMGSKGHEINVEHADTNG